MNKQERGIYVVLANKIDAQVCSFCKFSECVAGESPCDCGEPSCKHPLGYRFDEEYVEPGQDCRGFRPAYSVELCADIIGICLSKGWQSCVWWLDKQNQWKVAELSSV